MLERLINAWTTKSQLEDFAIMSLMIMPSLLLQKTSLKAKSKDNSTALKRRLELWGKGDIATLMFEGETIQSRLQQETLKRKTEKDSKIVCKIYARRQGKTGVKTFG